jgi:hypothetical protein
MHGPRWLERITAPEAVEVVVYTFGPIPVHVELGVYSEGDIYRGPYVFTEEDLEAIQSFLAGSIFERRIARWYGYVIRKVNVALSLELQRRLIRKLGWKRLKPVYLAFMARARMPEYCWQDIREFVEGRMPWR